MQITPDYSTFLNRDGSVAKSSPKDLNELTTRIQTLKQVTTELCQGLESINDSSKVQGVLKKYNFPSAAMTNPSSFIKQAVCQCIEEEANLTKNKTTIEYNQKSERDLKEIYSKTTDLDSHISQLDKERTEILTKLKNTKEGTTKPSSEELLELRNQLIKTTTSLEQNKIGLEAVQNKDIILTEKPRKDHGGKVHTFSDKTTTSPNKVKKQTKTTAKSSLKQFGKKIASKVLIPAVGVFTFAAGSGLKDTAIQALEGFTPGLISAATSTIVLVGLAYTLFSAKSKIDSSIEKEDAMMQENIQDTMDEENKVE